MPPIAPRPAAGRDLKGRDPSRTRVVLVTLGSRGDVQPFCVLARELKRRGYAVTLVANEDYRGLARSFGVDLADAGASAFGNDVVSGHGGALFDGSAGAWQRVIVARRVARSLQDRLAGAMTGCLDAILPADLVIYNAMAFFAGELAREAGIPAVRVTCQPLLPSSRMSLSLLGGRDLGRALNRASYEIFRALTATALRRALRTFRRTSGRGRRLRAGCNPLTLALPETHQLLAFSAALAADPGDWPRPACQPGFLLDEPGSAERLPAEVESFLAAGPPPVFVGFGSMWMRAERNTRLVLDALALRGGRAVLSKAGGGLKPPADLPPGILAVGAVSHALLFPRMSAVVHHGGSGTVAAALLAGRPNVVLPVLGDQLYWGRRVAAAGAAEAPIPLGRVTPAELAARIARVESDESYSLAATRVSAALARDPGVSGAADFVDRLTGAAATVPAA